MRTTRLASVAVAAGLGLTLAACGSSSKSSTPAAGTTPATAASADTVTAINHLTGVGTSVQLDPSTAKALSSLGVSVAPFGSATFDSATSTVTFPITSGYAEIHSDHSVKPGYIIGSVQHDGSGLTLSGGGKSLTVENFVVDPGNSMLYATAGGKPGIPLLFLDGTNVHVSMQGSNVVLDGTVAKLTDAAAQTLDSFFGTTAIKGGTPLGTVHLVASGQATTSTDKTTEITRLSGVSTSVALNSGTAAALKSLGVAVAPYGSATFDASTSTVSFPITGGAASIHTDTSVKPGYIDGAVLHQGSGLTLTAGGTTVTLTDFVVDPGDSYLYATVGGEPGDAGAKVGVPLLFLDGTNVKVGNSGGNVVLDGTVAKLTSTAASALDAAFHTSAITAGTPLGTVHLVASGTVSNG